MYINILFIIAIKVETVQTPIVYRMGEWIFIYSWNAILHSSINRYNIKWTNQSINSVQCNSIYKTNTIYKIKQCVV
jgi:hypothetical protein